MISMLIENDPQLGDVQNFGGQVHFFEKMDEIEADNEN